jgi:hypothetical protein
LDEQIPKSFSNSLLKKSFAPYVVIPAEAGIQSFQSILDSRLRGSDGKLEFFRILLKSP